MTPLEMIAEWRKSCSCAPKDKPEECYECTRGLIEAIERALLKEDSRMTKEHVHYLALIAAVQARIDGMKAENTHRVFCDNYVAYGEDAFFAEATLLEEYAMKVINL